MDVENLTCTGGRRLAVIREELEKMEDDAMFLAYAVLFPGICSGFLFLRLSCFSLYCTAIHI